jgi:hypothetical protein
MKSFTQFVKEAVETLASTEAKNRGLVGNGHGDWYDKQGNFIAKTVGGKLKFFGQGDTVSQDGVPGEEIKKTKNNQASSKQSSPNQTEPQQDSQKGIVIVLGRFNPPSKNHEQLLKAGLTNAKRMGYEYRIYPSRIQDGQTNPLSPKTKISLMRMIFNEYSDYIVDSEETKTVFDALISVYNDGYTDVTLVVGQDRLGEFQSLVHKGEGQDYKFNNMQVISAGIKDPDNEVETPGSSALMRTSAAIGDYERFIQGLPTGMKQSDKEKIFNIVSSSMNITEDTEIWRISPELDYDAMRWNYKNNGLFEVGTFVESLSSGLIGKILRRGANYLICVTEDGKMFKNWLKDVVEVYELGTSEYRSHAQSMTPGQPVISYTDVEIKPTMKGKRINKSIKKYFKIK